MREYHVLYCEYMDILHVDGATWEASSRLHDFEATIRAFLDCDEPISDAEFWS